MATAAILNYRELARLEYMSVAKYNVNNSSKMVENITQAEFRKKSHVKAWLKDLLTNFSKKTD